MNFEEKLAELRIFAILRIATRLRGLTPDQGYLRSAAKAENGKAVTILEALAKLDRIEAERRRHPIARHGIRPWLFWLLILELLVVLVLLVPRL